MRNINYFDKELSVEEYVKKEVCKNAGTQSVAFKEQLISLCSSAGIECNEKMKKEELFDLLCNNGFEYKQFADLFGIGVSSQVFLKIAKNPSNGGKYRIGKEKLLEKYGKLFSVTKRIILRYLHRLKRFFVMSITEGIYYIRPNAHFAEKNSGKTDTELLREHVNRFVLRRNRATYTEKEGKEASKLLTQYAGQVPDNRTLIRLFSEAVLESIRIRNAGIRNRYKWNRRLNPKFVHRLLQEKILNQPQMAK